MPYGQGWAMLGLMLDPEPDVMELGIFRNWSKWGPFLPIGSSGGINLTSRLIINKMSP